MPKIGGVISGGPASYYDGFGGMAFGGRKWCCIARPRRRTASFPSWRETANRGRLARPQSENAGSRHFMDGYAWVNW